VVPPETCRAVFRQNKLCNIASCWIYIGRITSNNRSVDAAAHVSLQYRHYKAQRSFEEAKLFELAWVVNRSVLLTKYYSGDQIEKNEMGGACSTYAKPEGDRPLGRPRRRWEDNIKLDLGEVG